LVAELQVKCIKLEKLVPILDLDSFSFDVSF